MNIPTPAEELKGGDVILLGDGQRARMVFDTRVIGQSVTIRFHDNLHGFVTTTTRIMTTTRAVGSLVPRVVR